ncbi:MAG: phosphatidylglycerophosphatase A [Myxococcales bacterium]|jgi:phosphatidylglycerophosphatase A|nr:phosphatidylglycerophosphatase A [Myxococcales bacterium]
MTPTEMPTKDDTANTSPSTPPSHPPLTWPDRIFLTFATGFGTGFSPKAPGTVGTLVGVLFHLGIAQLHPAVQVVTIAALVALAIHAAARAALRFGNSDDGRIVSDEIVGYLVTMAFVPAEPLYLFAGFVLFRVFDILKPWPCSYFDKKWKNAVGNVMDDVCAGLYARLLLLIWMLVWGA